MKLSFINSTIITNHCLVPNVTFKLNNISKENKVTSSTITNISKENKRTLSTESIILRFFIKDNNL